MASALQGKLFFITTGAFAFGILCGTVSHVRLEYLLLSIFLAILCFLGFLLHIQNITDSYSRSRIIWLVVGLVLSAFPVGEVRATLAPHALPSAYVPLLTSSTPGNSSAGSAGSSSVSVADASQLSLIGTIVADSDIRQKNQQLVISVEKDGQRTNLLAFAPLFQHFEYGERVLIAGTLEAPAPFETDSGRTFRYDNYLAKKGIFAIVPRADILEVAPPKGFINEFVNFLFGIKHIFVEGLSKALPDPYAELATGLLTGDQHGLSDALVTVLALSGLIWVVVLSGYHVTLIANGVLKLFSFLPRRFGFFLAAISIMAIVFVTGASAPSLRGGIMACLTLYARATNRTYDALRALCTTVILILFWNPLLLAYDSGFQLSVIVTPALLLATPALEGHLLWIKSSLLREIISVSTIAQLACLPLILWQTGELNVWAIPANIFVMSLVPVAMIVSFGAGFVGSVVQFIPLLNPLASLAGLPAYAILYYIIFIAKTSATLPFADVLLPPFPFMLVPVMYGIFIWIVCLLKRKQRDPQSHSIFGTATPPHSRNASR